jgi:two-component system, sensor histidine kinase RpfC
MENFMNVTAALHARRSDRFRVELEEALLRIALLGLITLFLWGHISGSGAALAEHDKILLTGLAGWLILAIGIFAVIWTWPAANGPLRLLGMVVDVGAITYWLFLAGESGAVFVGAYLFIIFGKGFRYGRAYLFACQILSLVGFMGVVVAGAPWWQDEMAVAAGWIVSMIVLPFYIATLAERMNAARVKAEEALKECVDRERRVP